MAVLLVPVFRAAGEGRSAGAAWWGWPFALLASALGALLVVSFLAPPASRRLVELGCSPCARAAGATLVLALMAHAAGPDNVGMAVLAVALLAGGLRQRLSEGGCSSAP